MTEIPILPVYPGPAASAEALEQFAAELKLFNAAVEAVKAEALAATAASQAGIDRSLQVSGDVRKPTRAELWWDMVKRQPQASILTPSHIVNGARDIVDAFIKSCPGAVEG